MKIKEIFLELLYDGPKITIKLQKGENYAATSFMDSLGPINQEKEYDIKVQQRKKLRSLDANAYMWTLLGQLSKAVRPPVKKEDLYRQYVKDYGVFEIVPVREDAVFRWFSAWESRGTGWVCKDLGKCKHTPGYNNILCCYGSSTYTTEEMSILIDAVVADCKEMGIETLPPDELQRLKELWG